MSPYHTELTTHSARARFLSLSMPSLSPCHPKALTTLPPGCGQVSPSSSKVASKRHTQRVAREQQHPPSSSSSSNRNGAQQRYRASERACAHVAAGASSIVTAPTAEARPWAPRGQRGPCAASRPSACCDTAPRGHVAPSCCSPEAGASACCLHLWAGGRVGGRRAGCARPSLGTRRTCAGHGQTVRSGQSGADSQMRAYAATGAGTGVARRRQAGLCLCAWLRLCLRSAQPTLGAGRQQAVWYGIVLLPTGRRQALCHMRHA
jgi:hypothetical protein